MNHQARRRFDRSSEDYLSTFDDTEQAKQLSVVKKWIKSEPLELFKQLRTERPILVTPECIFVSRFDDVRDILQMPQIFTTQLYKYTMDTNQNEDDEHLSSHDDDALHSREKSIMQAMFNRSDLPRIRRLISHSCAKILNRTPGSIDIVNSYCRMIPAILAEEYFGLDGIDKKELINWSFWYRYNIFHNQAFNQNSSLKSDFIHQRHMEAMKNLDKGIKRILARKLAIVEREQSKNVFLNSWKALQSLVNSIQGKTIEPPKDDTLNRLLRCNFPSELEFSPHRIAKNMSSLLINSIETTSQAVAQVIQFFISQPELLVKAKIAASARTTENFDNMVWEALRFVPISPYLFRQTAQEHVLAKGTSRETLIPRGTNVLLLTQSAMFDSACYDKAEEFNPNRNWSHHFNYGFGHHDCLGKYIAMEMIPEMVKQVIRLPSIISLDDIDYKEGPFPESYELKWSIR